MHSLSRLGWLNVTLLGAAACFAFGLTRELATSRPLPGLPARQAAPASPKGTADVSSLGVSVRRDERALYSAIADKNIFSPSRSNTSVIADGPGGKPFLHGVVMNDLKSRAYLEDPASKKIFGYAVGDSVGGGRLDAIRADRVVIVRSEGPMEVLLRDPSKPRPTATVTASATGAAIPTSTPAPQPIPSAGPSPGSLPGPFPVPVAGAAGSPAPPRPLQSIPPDFLRRPRVATQPEEPASVPRSAPQ
jgi:hypothetical protein